MSNFKRMRLINEDEIIPHKKDEIYGFAKHETSPHILRMSDLDDQINDILKSNLNEENKAKLYSQALRKFLTYKRLHQDKQLVDRNQGLDLLKKLNITPQLRKITVKKKKIPIIRKRKIVIRKKKKNIGNRPNLQIQEAVDIHNIPSISATSRPSSLEKLFKNKKEKKIRNKPKLQFQEAIDIHNIPSTSGTSQSQNIASATERPSSQKFEWRGKSLDQIVKEYKLDKAPKKKKKLLPPTINLEDSEEDDTIDWSQYES